MMYQRQGKLEEFNKLKPVITERQEGLLNAFYCLDKERGYEQSAPLAIKDKDIRHYQRYNGSCFMAPDLFIMCINLIDSEYLKMKFEEMQRKAKKAKS